MAKKQTQRDLAPRRTSAPAVAPALLRDIRALVEAAREQAARAVNSTLVVMYWQIGRRIRQDVLQNSGRST